jgi:hypothetical protein
MEVELTDHLGYEPHQEPPGGAGNTRSRQRRDRGVHAAAAVHKPHYMATEERSGGAVGREIFVAFSRREIVAAQPTARSVRRRSR